MDLESLNKSLFLLIVSDCSLSSPLVISKITSSPDMLANWTTTGGTTTEHPRDNNWGQQRQQLDNNSNNWTSMKLNIPRRVLTDNDGSGM